MATKLKSYPHKFITVIEIVHGLAHPALHHTLPKLTLKKIEKTSKLSVVINLLAGYPYFGKNKFQDFARIFTGEK